MRSSSRRFFGVPAKRRSIFVGCIIAALLAATTIHPITWQRVYGGDNGGATGNCVLQTSDSGYVVTGTWSLLRTNMYGDTLWSRDYGTGLWIEQTTDGSYVIAGVPNLLKTNEDGDSIWTHDYGIISNCVRQTSNGDYIVTGSQGAPLVLLKTDSDGDSLWLKMYEEPGHNINVGYFVEETSDSGYIITGATGIEEGEEFATHYLWLLKTDVDGNVQWKQRYGTGGYAEFNKGLCVRQTSDGGYIIAGEKGFAPSGFWLLKTDENGDTLWTKIYGGEYGGCVIETPEGDYVAVGRGAAVSIWESSLPNGGDVLQLKVDPAGNTLWLHNHGGDDSDWGDCIAQTSDGGYIVSGGSWSFGVTNSALYLLKTDSLGLLDAITEEPIADLIENWAVTSVGSQTLLRYWNFSKGFYASVFDVAGRKVDEIRTTESAGTLTWGQDHPSGVYFIRVFENQKISSAKVEIVR